MAIQYLVTGGAGPLGKLIICRLRERGETVRILMSEKSDVSEYQAVGADIYYGISTDKETMKEFFDVEEPRKCVLIHADEYISLTDATNLVMRRVNVTGAENIVDMCLKKKIGRLVYLSSAYALDPQIQGDQMQLYFDRGRVTGEYAKTKAEAAANIMEKVAMNRLNAVMVLPTFIIGPGYSEDYGINRILTAYLKNGTLPIKEGGGHAFVDVRDVATSMLNLAEKGEPGSGYIISGEYKSSEEFFEHVNDIKGLEAPKKMTPKWIMKKNLKKFVDTYYKITHRENPNMAYALFQDNPEKKYESSNDSDIIPAESISFKDSITDSIKWFEE